MQNHHHHNHFVSTSSSLSRSSNCNSDNNSSTFATGNMLQSSGPGGNDPFPSQHGHEFKDYATLTSVNGGGGGGTDYGHLSSGGGHNNNNHHHHGGGGHHGHGANNHHGGEPVVNSSSGGSGSGSGAAKPKKPPPPNGKKTKGRVKIKMEFIDNKLRRYTTFSKRKTGIMKKAYELSTLTGTQVMLLVASETGHVYTFATRKLQPMITSEAGKALIQTCLNSPDPPNSGSDTQRMSATGYEETELTYAADPNGSDHDVKDGGDDSDSMSTDEDESSNGREMGASSAATMIPLTNGLLPANFAALLAASQGLNPASLKASGLSIGLVPAPAPAPITVSSSSAQHTHATQAHAHVVHQKIPPHSHVVLPHRPQIRIETTATNSSTNSKRSPQKGATSGSANQQQSQSQKRVAPSAKSRSSPVKASKIKREHK